MSFILILTFMKRPEKSIQDFHANNDGFQIRAGTSNSHAADPVLLRRVQFFNGNFVLHAAFQVICDIDRNQLRQFHFMSGINSSFCVLPFMKWNCRSRFRTML